MKIALVHDAISYRAGGERVLLNMHRAFPQAPIYTSIYDPANVFPEFRECDIRTNWFQYIAKNETQYKRLFFPFCIWSMESLDLSDYDIVLMSTTHCAKYVRTSKSALVIAYCYTPFRLAWDPDSYNAYKYSKGLKRILFDVIIRRLKQIDFKHSKKVDYFVAMTSETAGRIRSNYGYLQDIQIIRPSIEVGNYHISNNIGDYFLVVSRLESYKKIDLVIEAFNKLNLPLKIVGNGTEKEKLFKMASRNIEFLEGIDDNELVELYSKCKALIFPQHEDYGLTPLEANACGRPVICYKKGGVLETMLPFVDDSRQCTAIFFEHQVVDCLIEAINIFEELRFNPEFIRKHAEKFDNAVFINNIRNFVTSRYNDHLRKI